MKRISLFFATAFLIVLLTGCGNGIKVAGCVELGTEEPDLIGILEVKDGYTVSVKDDSKLDTALPGKYEVTYLVDDGEEKEVVLKVEVKDTVKPEITTGDVVTVTKGKDFDIDAIISVEDADSEITLSYTGEVDTSKKGKYPITVTAKDSSGNESSKEITINVGKRRNCDFRNAKWGDSKETVKMYEELTVGEEDENAISYIGTINNLDCSILYSFKNDKLVKGFYFITEHHSTPSSYISDYQELKKQLKSKYGKPYADEKIPTDRLAYICSSDGEALQLGALIYRAKWTTKTSKIYIILQNDNYEYVLSIFYQDRNYKEDGADENL